MSPLHYNIFYLKYVVIELRNIFFLNESRLCIAIFPNIYINVGIGLQYIFLIFDVIALQYIFLGNMSSLDCNIFILFPYIYVGFVLQYIFPNMHWRQPEQTSLITPNHLHKSARRLNSHVMSHHVAVMDHVVNQYLSRAVDCGQLVGPQATVLIIDKTKT